MKEKCEYYFNGEKKMKEKCEYYFNGEKKMKEIEISVGGAIRRLKAIERGLC